MDNVTTRITTEKQTSGYWRVTLNHPPINTIDDQMYDEVFDLVEAIEAEPSLKVVTFESANPDFFLAHYVVGESASRFGKPRWIEAATRLAHSNVLIIAVIRGRTRAGGSEFALACDLRFASREKAFFGQPEVGWGLIAGGGHLRACPFWSGDRGQSRSRLEETISMPRWPRDMAGSIAPSPTRSSTASSPISCAAFCHSMARR
jgi:enoyl-CoA hydratase/carnithine racemase